MSMEELTQNSYLPLLDELYKLHYDFDKDLKSDVFADGNGDDFDHGTVQGWKEAMEFVISKLEKLKDQEYVENSILRGKIKTYKGTIKSYGRVTEMLNQKLGKAELDLYDARYKKPHLIMESKSSGANPSQR